MHSCGQIVQSDTFHARTHGQIMQSDGKVVQSCTFHARIVKFELCKVNVLCIVYSVIDRCGCVQRGGQISMCLRARACVCVRACVLISLSPVTGMFWLQGLRPMLPDMCKDCVMWLNGAVQMQEHKLGKKHKKYVRHGKTAQRPRGKGILVPHGTVIMLEQNALLNDVDTVWLVRRSIYATIASRLACFRARIDGRCGIPSAI
jgi:hypothetical protein